MEIFLLILGAVVGGALGFRYGNRHAPRAELDSNAATLATFLRIIDRQLDRNTSAAVRGIAWETYGGNFGQALRRNGTRARHHPEPVPTPRSAP
jgi:hypothetical protein